MNVYITIGYKRDGTSKVLAGTEVPYEKQKEILKSSKSYVLIEMWSRSQGKIRARKFKEGVQSKTKKVVEVEETPSADTEDTPEKTEEK